MKQNNRPFYQSTFMMPLDVIEAGAYYTFANGFFSAKGQFYADDADITDIDQLDAVVSRHVKACEYDQQRVMTILPSGARRFLRAIAAKRKVKEPQSGSFVAKYGLRAASSVKTSLDMLVEKELVYPTPDEYVVYDRLMAEYLRCLGK